LPLGLRPLRRLTGRRLLTRSIGVELCRTGFSLATLDGPQSPDSGAHGAEGCAECKRPTGTKQPGCGSYAGTSFNTKR
jgi:hypothetical protein